MRNNTAECCTYMRRYVSFRHTIRLFRYGFLMPLLIDMFFAATTMPLFSLAVAVTPSPPIYC